MNRLLILLVSGCSIPAPSISPDAAVPPPDAEPTRLVVTVEGNGVGQITSVPAGIDCPGDCEQAFEPGTTVTLTAVGGADTSLTSWFGAAEACDADTECPIEVEGETVAGARLYLDFAVAFVSSTEVIPALLGGRAGADAECARLAGDAGLPGDPASYLAWVGASDFGPILPQNAGWVRTDGETFAQTLAQLRAGAVRYPLRLDERGNDVGPDQRVVTDIAQNGGARPDTSHCDDYTSPVGRIAVGRTGAGTRLWTDAETIACDEPARLYCFGSGAADPAPGPDDTGLFAFLGPPFPPGGGTTAADAACDSQGQMLVGGGEFLALLADAGASPGERVTSGTNWVRPDSVEVFASLGDLRAGAFRAPINVGTSGGAFGSGLIFAWLGAPSVGEVAANLDCAGWTQIGDNTDALVIEPMDGGGVDAVPRPCSSDARLLCVQVP